MLNDNYAVLQKIVAPQETLRLFASHLLQSGIIDDAVISNPTYHSIIGNFTAALPVLTTIDAIEEHCQKFIDALRELGGAGAMGCADKLRDGWKETAKSHGYEKFLNDKGMGSWFLCTGIRDN